MSAATGRNCAVPADSLWGAGAGPLESVLLPIVPRMAVKLEDGELRRLQGIAARIAAKEPALAATQAFGPRTRPGIFSNRWLVVGDAREITLAKVDEEPAYEYRLSLLARQGDLVVFGGEPNAGFERYRAQFLGHGPVHVLYPRGDPGNPLLPLADRCRLDPAVFSQIVEVARREGSLTVVPHIGMGSAWRLAAAVAEVAGVDVRVMSAPPRLTRRVNDKLWFARLVAEVVGPGAIPPTDSAHCVAVLAHRVRALARRAERVVVKVPDSSGGAGNFCLDARDLRDASLADIKDRICGALHAAGWCDAYPLLVGLWEATALCSPSVQLWIPAVSDGSPVIEGSFEQILEGRDGVFVGSVPAQLPEHWKLRMAEEAMRLATVLQLLGYFGRCSLDSLLIGETLDAADLHWIECNGRWGGVSIPLTIVNRLRGGTARSEFVVVQRLGETFSPRPFGEAVRALDGLLFRSGARDDGIVLLSPIEIESGRGVQMLACAKTVPEARELSDNALGILAGSWEIPDRRLAYLRARALVH